MSATTAATSGDAAAVIAASFATGERAQWNAAQWRTLSRAELLAVHRELAATRRRVDAALAASAAEIDRLSDPADGPGGLARREGFANPIRMVAASTGGSNAEAGRLIAVGKATLNASEPEPLPGPDAADDSAVAPALRFAHLADAVNAGRISMDAAAAISAMLERVAETVEPEVWSEAERLLVERAQSLPLDRLAALVRQCETELDAKTALMKEEARRASRYLNIFENRDGLVIVDGRLDPETAAPLKAAVDAMVADSLRRRRDASGSDCAADGDSSIADTGTDGGVGTGGGTGTGGGADALADDRTVPQMRADALSDLAKHALGCDAKDLPLPKATVVVRMGVDQLKNGLGMGEIDGIDQPMSIGALRRMAADAEVIPEVLGGDSEVLDLGRARRFFTRAQRLALVERDGGCAWCHAPPSWCEAHHIRWWHRDKGRSDLSNGVLLCTSCHHRIHRDNWGIEVRGRTVWFTPPAAVDRERTPILGGRARFEYSAAA